MIVMANSSLSKTTTRQDYSIKKSGYKRHSRNSDIVIVVSINETAFGWLENNVEFKCFEIGSLLKKST
jgi:hypothetical protein